MADSFSESGGIEPLIDGPVGNTIWLVGNEIRIFEVVAVILAVRTLINELRTAGIILEDRSDAPPIQEATRQRIPARTQFGKVIDGSDRQVMTLFGQPVRPYFLKRILGLVALLVRAAALIVPI